MRWAGTVASVELPGPLTPYGPASPDGSNRQIFHATQGAAHKEGEMANETKTTARYSTPRTCFAGTTQRPPLRLETVCTDDASVAALVEMVLEFDMSRGEHVQEGGGDIDDTPEISRARAAIAAATTPNTTN